MQRSEKEHFIRPRSIRLDASTVCQLKCPACPNASGIIGKHLGRGFLRFEDFKNIVDSNPWVSHIELSNWGEIFLNRELTAMVRYAFQKHVALSAGNGANFNDVPEEVLEQLVKFKFRALKCSIDGASAATYSGYRVNGDLDRVVGNIRTLNKYKTTYASPWPALQWQFVAFGHNEHEIGRARRMALDLNMDFYLKLSWDDLYGRPFSPVKDTGLIRRESGVGAADRCEYRKKFKREYALRACCSCLWKTPQINYDGRVLGCPVNYWGDYGNAFRKGLLECVNSDKIRYARAMVMGMKEPRKDIPCSTCPAYQRMQENQSWLTSQEVIRSSMRGRVHVLFENKGYGEAMESWSEIWGAVKDRIKPGKGAHSTQLRSRLSSQVHPLLLPLQPDEEKGWRPYGIFRGRTSVLKKLSCHVSVLNPGRCPHLPHAHPEEELLLLLSGEVDLVFPVSEPPYGNRRRNLKAGQFVYYPRGFFHTLQTVSEFPACYLMFKWSAPGKRSTEQLSHRLHPADMQQSGHAGDKGFRTHVVFQGPTAALGKLQAHHSELAPGAGYSSSRRFL